MLFKSYPTYICFLSDIYMFLKEHIFSMFNNILYKTKYFFYNIFMFLNNKYMLFNIIAHMYVMYPGITYM